MKYWLDNVENIFIQMTMDTSALFCLTVFVHILMECCRNCSACLITKNN